MSCPDERLRSLIEPMAKAWSYETGATTEVVAAPMGDATDVAILPMAELGVWADRGELLPVPLNLRESGHSYQWSTVLQSLRGESYAGWGGQVLGLPVAAETSLIVFRSDRFTDPAVQADFRKSRGRALTPPTTWESFAEIAAFFTEREKKPSLPPVDAPRLEELFMRVAACFDRPALAGEGRDEALGFAFDVKTGRPRLDSQGMVAAAQWLARLKSSGSISTTGGGDPAAALRDGHAIMAVASLKDVMNLDADGRRTGKYGLAALPGSSRYLNPATGRFASVPLNRVPWLAGGWLGVVKSSCKSPDAAFAFLAEITGPARSQEIVAAGGYAPVREAQLEADRLLVWLGYGFDDKTTRQLQDIVRLNLGASVRNPVYALRTPDQAELRKSLQMELGGIANGTITPEAGLKSANEQWGRTLHVEWRRRAAGLN